MAYPSNGMEDPDLPCRRHFLRPSANPTLESIDSVRTILRASPDPIDRFEILRILAMRSHSMTQAALNAALRFLASEGSVLEKSTGLVWVPVAFPELTGNVQKHP